MGLPRRSDGKLWSFTPIGSYPLVYHTVDMGDLCPACANGENGSDASEESDDAQWRLAGVRVHWEGPPIQCEHCYADIESAYGDPDDAPSQD